MDCIIIRIIIVHKYNIYSVMIESTYHNIIIVRIIIIASYMWTKRRRLENTHTQAKSTHSKCHQTREI